MASGSETTIRKVSEVRTDEFGKEYRPNIQARNIIIQRTSTNFGHPGISTQVSKRESAGRYSVTGMDPSAYVALSTTGVTAVKDSREREKKDMQDLNERLANYIEKVRFLEAQNRRLADELEKLKARWGKETSQIKAMYQAELDEARRLLDDAVREKSRLEIRVASVEELMEEMRQRMEDALREAAEAKEKIESQNQQLSNLESEVALLRRRCEAFDKERDKEKGLIKKLQEALNNARSDLDNETLLHVDAENRRQTLEEELEFLKALFDQERKELEALAYRDSTSENREYWKSEMGQALREIQAAYDDKLDVMKGELETYYNLKIQEFRNGATRNNMETVHFKEESKRLRDQLTSLRDKIAEQDGRIGQLMRELDALRREKEDQERELTLKNGELSEECIKLRAEMEAMLKELQMIIDAKLGLELEIMAYRRLLEGEENRSGLRQIVDSILPSSHHESHEVTVRQTEVTSGDSSMRLSQVTKGEISAKTTFQKSAKGPVAIYETDATGKFVALENSGRKEEPLGNWSLTRTVDGKDVANYKFKETFVLRPGDKIKLWAKGTKPHGAPSTDVETDQTWGVGANVVTKLVNPSGEDRATHIQRTTYG